MNEQHRPGRLLAFVRDSLAEGPILEAAEAFEFECRENGAWSIEDHDMQRPDGPGLQVFEGWTYYGPGPEPDVAFAGEWRKLTHWEMCRLRFGMRILGDGQRESGT